MPRVKVTPKRIFAALDTAGRGMTNREIAAALGVCQASTFYWLKGMALRREIAQSHTYPRRYATDARLFRCGGGPAQ